MFFLTALSLRAQDATAAAAMQASQQATQAAIQATQQANDAMAQAVAQANQAALAASQQAMANTPSPGPLPQKSPYGPADKPHFYPPPGKFPVGTRVSIQDSTPKAAIYYTLDGSEPTTSSTPYTKPIVLSATSRVRAIARSPIYSPSRVANGTYVIK
jgi:hypothetical protein